MDGVLVDVSDSYRTAIQYTVAHYTGREVERDVIQDYKNQGGWNDDWALSHRLIQDAGLEIPYQEIVDYFQSIFHGTNGDGLISRERWIAKAGLLEKLGESHSLAVFTGRLHWEADLTLNRFAPGLIETVIGVDDVLHAKPAPEGILKIQAAVVHSAVWYVGDTVDDARAASAARVPFIGIAAPASPRVGELAELLKREGAIAVLPDINQLPDVVGKA